MSSEFTLGVGEEAIQALTALINRIMEIHTDVVGNAKSLKVVCEENSSGLGCHADSITMLVEDLGKIADKSPAVMKLVRNLSTSLKVRQALSSNDIYKGKGESS